MSDKAQKLNNLQDILIDEFIERITSGAATPSDLNAARQLLKDNGIHAAVSNNNPLEALTKVLPFEDPSDNIISINEKLQKRV